MKDISRDRIEIFGLEDSYCEPKFNIQTATGSITHNPVKSESLQDTMESE